MFRMRIWKEDEFGAETVGDQASCDGVTRESGTRATAESTLNTSRGAAGGSFADDVDGVAASGCW